MTGNSNNFSGNISKHLSICSIITGDFNASCSRWRNSDITNKIGSEIGNLTSSAGSKQIIEKNLHGVNDYLPVCISYFITTRKQFQSIVFLAHITIILYMALHKK